MQIILPKTFVAPEKIDQPLFFLAGPHRGGDNWQEKCCLKLSEYLGDSFMVVPNLWSSENLLFNKQISGDENMFASRTAWEHYYLNLTAERSKQKQGVIIFWLPCESKVAPREDGHPYARDTYSELAAWRRSAALDKKIHLVVGAEPKFPGLEEIQENFNLDFGKEYPIYHSLEEVVQEAIKWCKPS